PRAVQPSMGRSRRNTRVIDVEGVDSDERLALRDQDVARPRSEDGVVGEVGRRAPALGGIGPHQDGTAVQLKVLESRFANLSAGGCGIDDNDGQIRESLEVKSGEVGAVTVAMPRRVDVRAGVPAEVEAGDVELCLTLVALAG